MPDAAPTRTTFIDRVLTSRLPGETAIRFQFTDGEAAAVYTLGPNAPTGQAQHVVLFVATFPPALPQAGVHDFGLNYCEQVVASAAEAHSLLAQFDQAQAAQFRASCRAQRP